MSSSFISKRRKKKNKEEMIVGTLSKNRKGFGFVIPKDNSDGDIFIGRSGLNGAMHGDYVAVRLLSGRDQDKAKEGVISIVLKRAVTEVVGTFEKSKKFGFVVPDDKRLNDDVFVHRRDFNGAQKGDKVVVEIRKYPDKDHSAEGRIKEIICRYGEAGGDIKALIRQYNLYKEFPYKVDAEAEKVAREITQDDLEGRRDLRHKVIITIDGADAKDFDDAVSVEKLENGHYLLGVHIADVSHYVKEGSSIDNEAYKRGNSVYLIDQVIPMLPEVLSNGVCSLNPKVDRLTLSVDLEIDSKGKVIAHDIYESVIRSTERMVYTDVSDILEKNAVDLQSKYAHIYKDLLLMHELAKILRKVREDRGSLDFDFDEAFITLNEEGIPISITTAERREANKIIEEFMLITNETVAEHFFWLELPFVYRVHEKPSEEKIEEFKRFIQSFGFNLRGAADGIHPRNLNEILHKVEGRPEENVVNTVMLRSMKKAFYDTECLGHFGLGIKYYCHFTSPIRRYPDLIIHRIIKESLRGTLDRKRIKDLKKRTGKAAETSSDTERQAQELEREVEKLKKAEYMSYHVGEVFDGIISGVASFGFFVEIENTIEGMVKVDTLHDDFYDYEGTKYRLIGRRTKKLYTLGDKVRIQVSSVDIQNREINFIIAEEQLGCE
jgi:ribonuclease R